MLFYIIISPTCRGAISLAEMKPVEPEEARTSVGNKRVLNSSLKSKTFIIQTLFAFAQHFISPRCCTSI